MGAGVLGLPRPSSAQADFKAAFVESVQRFSVAPDRASLEAMTRALARWDASVRASEAQFAASLPGSSAPVAARMHTALGAMYLERGRLQDALREFDAGAHLDPARADVFAFQGAASDQLLHDRERAATAYRQAAALDPLNATRAYLLARALERAGKPVEAADAYRGVLRLWQRDVGAHVSIAIDRPFIQLALIEEAPGTQPFFPPERYAEGFTLLKRGEYSAAVDSFTKAVESPRPSAPGPDNPGASHYANARQLHRQNRTVDALAEYEAAVQDGLFVGAGRLLQTIGGLQAAQQNFDAALAADEARVDLSLNDANAHSTLGYLLARLDRHDEALAEFAIALTIAPDAPDLHVAMAQIHLQHGDFTAAADAAKRAIALNPAHKQARYSLATALVRLGRADEAAPEFAAFERLQSEDTAVASQQMKINGLKRALELDPDNPDLLKQLAEASARAKAKADTPR